MHLLHGLFGIGTAHASELPQIDDDRIAAIRDQLAHDLGLTAAQAGGFLAAPYAESGLHGIEQRYGLKPGEAPD
ncbi:hypothetical protein, partial [Acidisphaera rubrifaciens]|uniref:hypothetical protein n=1 Tax=Acidisphaera rubrifaciens TaxID=50715 RepID=UPI0011DD144D